MHFATVHQASTPYPTPSPKRVLSFYSSEKIHTYIYILLEAPSSSYLSWKLIYMGVCVCVCVCVTCSVVWLFATPWTVASQPGSSVHGILQARILEWVAILFSSRSFWPRDQTWVSCISRWIFFTFEPPGKRIYMDNQTNSFSFSLFSALFCLLLT